MNISIPIFLLFIILGLIALAIGFKIKGNDKVFGRQLKTSKQVWARFWLTCGWVILLLVALYGIFILIARVFLQFY